MLRIFIGRNIPDAKFLSENMKRRPLGRPRRRWEDNIRMELRVRCGLDTSD
jgi:hypothetical protein